MCLPLAEVDWNAVITDDPIGLIVCSLWVVIGLIVLAAIIAVQWRKHRAARDNAVLKQQMIERGFSADEIIRVIEAGGSGRRAGKTPAGKGQPAARGCCPDPVAR